MQTLPVRKFLHQILGDKYDVGTDEIVQRMLSGLPLESDLKKTAAIFEKIYHAGFNAAVEQYRAELAKMGQNVEVVKDEEAPKY